MGERHDPASAPQATGGYTQGLEVVGPGRLLHVSGQIPETAAGTVDPDFDAQCAQVWANVSAVLRSAGMTVADLIKVTTYLASRGDSEANARIRQNVLGDHKPALTVVIAGIYDEDWLLEVEATAFRPL